MNVAQDSLDSFVSLHSFISIIKRNLQMINFCLTFKTSQSVFYGES